MAYLNGQGGTITAGGNSLPVESWSLNISSEALDVTTTASAGWMQVIAGINSAEGSVKAFWDAAAQPTAAAGLNIRAGVTAAFVLPIGSSGSSYSFSGLVTQVTVENPSKGVVSFSASFKCNGAVTYPV